MKKPDAARHTHSHYAQVVPSHAAIKPVKMLGAEGVEADFLRV